MPKKLVDILELELDTDEGESQNVTDLTAQSVGSAFCAVSEMK